MIEGTPNWTGNWNKQWYGVRRFFGYLESKAYKMHPRAAVRVPQLHALHGAAARPEAESLLWRMGTRADADAVLPPAQRFMPPAWPGRARS